MARLTEEFKDRVIKAVGEDLSFVAVAERFGTTKNAVAGIMSRHRENLRRITRQKVLDATLVEEAAKALPRPQPTREARKAAFRAVMDSL